ncbi:FecR family protein [Sandaracinus amylolyticus]|uniref:FecR family protein n=1 Tax=Sandaracinus amylolyticus TaxID=927083 RepID=UPI001F3D41D5|nr:FecR family protein [Sandaracinus amylolyticus]UJR87087.1 Hypothetical protein I5071_91880 [Sandaracinus amylolyticus]
MTRRDASARAVDALRASPPELDELRRARMERRLVDAVGRGERARETGVEPRRSGGRAWAAAGGALAVAAVVGLAVIVRPVLFGGGEQRPVARFEMGGTRTASGTLDVGGALEVGPGERAEVRVGGVELDLEGGSAMRFGSLDVRDVRVELTSGGVDVAFHPRERGRERLSIETPSARVEVVGTVFSVRLQGGATRVAVREGTVRVVPRRASESAVLVHAGESVEIDGEPAAEARAPEPAAAPVETVEPPVAVVVEAAPRARRETAPAAPIAPALPRAVEPAAIEIADEVPSAVVQPPEVAPVSPRQRLAAARHVLEDLRDHPRARAMLVELVRDRDAPIDVRAEAQTLIADSFLATGEAHEAADAYERAAALGRGRPEGANALFSLARLQEGALRDRDAARATYVRYLQEAPHGAHAQLVRAAVCRLGGDPAVPCGGGGAR